MDEEFEAAPQDEEFALPRSTIRKLIADAIPGDMSIAKETYDLVSECCLEFIHMLSSEAQEICDKSQKKTVSGEHVIDALQNLGFPSFVPPTKEVYDKFNALTKEHQTARRGSKKNNDSGMTDEELAELQMKQLEESKRRYLESLKQSD